MSKVEYLFNLSETRYSSDVVQKCLDAMRRGEPRASIKDKYGPSLPTLSAWAKNPPKPTKKETKNAPLTKTFKPKVVSLSSVQSKTAQATAPAPKKSKPRWYNIGGKLSNQTKFNSPDTAVLADGHSYLQRKGGVWRSSSNGVNSWEEIKPPLAAKLELAFKNPDYRNEFRIGKHMGAKKEIDPSEGRKRTASQLKSLEKLGHAGRDVTRKELLELKDLTVDVDDGRGNFSKELNQKGYEILLKNTPQWEREKLVNGAKHPRQVLKAWQKNCTKGEREDFKRVAKQHGMLGDLDKKEALVQERANEIHAKISELAGKVKTTEAKKRLEYLAGNLQPKDIQEISELNGSFASEAALSWEEAKGAEAKKAIGNLLAFLGAVKKHKVGENVEFVGKEHSLAPNNPMWKGDPAVVVQHGWTHGNSLLVKPIVAQAK